jgi:predicted RNase H-like nuclease (RuvC/YqgF family)
MEIPQQRVDYGCRENPENEKKSEGGDVAALNAIIATLRVENEQLKKENESLKAEIESSNKVIQNLQKSISNTPAKNFPK